MPEQSFHSLWSFFACSLSFVQDNNNNIKRKLIKKWKRTSKLEKDKNEEKQPRNSAGFCLIIYQKTSSYWFTHLFPVSSYQLKTFCFQICCQFLEKRCYKFLTKSVWRNWSPSDLTYGPVTDLLLWNQSYKPLLSWLKHGALNVEVDREKAHIRANFKQILWIVSIVFTFHNTTWADMSLYLLLVESFMT